MFGPVRKYPVAFAAKYSGRLRAATDTQASAGFPKEEGSCKQQFTTNKITDG
jgi:hypothetical protein